MRVPVARLDLAGRKVDVEHADVVVLERQVVGVGGYLQRVERVSSDWDCAQRPTARTAIASAKSSANLRGFTVNLPWVPDNIPSPGQEA